jgi:hypothetical protein
LGICTTGGVNAEVVGAIVERTRQRRITGVSFVCVCVFFQFLCHPCIIIFVCPADVMQCTTNSNIHEAAALKQLQSFSFCVEKKLQVGERLIRYSRLVHHKASMHF